MTAALPTTSQCWLCLFMQHVAPLISGNGQLGKWVKQSLTQKHNETCNVMPSNFGSEGPLASASGEAVTLAFPTAIPKASQLRLVVTRRDTCHVFHGSNSRIASSPPFSRLCQKPKRLAGIPGLTALLKRCTEKTWKNSQEQQWKILKAVLNLRSQLNLIQRLSPCSQPSRALSPWSCVPGKSKPEHQIGLRLEWVGIFFRLCLLEEGPVLSRLALQIFMVFTSSWVIAVSQCEPCGLCCME